MQETKLRSTENYVWLDPTDKLGRGGYGEVFKCRHLATGEIYAAKCFTSKNSSVAEYKMLNYLKDFNHKNIMRMIAFETEHDKGQSKVIIMDYCEGSLSHFLASPENNCGISDDELILFITDIVSAIEFLREKQIVHRDIKPSNILKYVAKEGLTFYRLTDFGSACKAADDQPLNDVHGTDEYLHPQIYGRLRNLSKEKSEDFRYYANSDLWSLGVTIYQLATGSLPFRPYNGRVDHKTMYKILTEKHPDHISGVQDKPYGNIHYEKTLPASCRLSNNFRRYLEQFIAALLQVEPAKMLRFDEVFRKTASLRSSQFLELFVLSACTFDRVYVFSDSDDMLVGPRVDFAEAVRFYVNEMYEIECNECDLLLPFATQSTSGYAKDSSSESKLHSARTAADTMNYDLLPLAKTDDLASIVRSSESARQRVALSALDNRFDSTRFVTQIDALKLCSAEQQRDENNLPTPKACVVAMRRVNIEKFFSKTSTYKSDCVKQLSAVNTMRASLDAQIDASNKGIALAHRLIGYSNSDNSGHYEAAVRTGLAYTTYRAGVALADAQALIAASSNHLVLGLQRSMSVVSQIAAYFECECDRALALLTSMQYFIEVQSTLLRVIENNHSKLNVQDEELLTLIRKRLELLQSFAVPVLIRQVRSKFDEMDKRRRQYHDKVLVEDVLSRSWQQTLEDNHCFGRVCSFGRFAREAVLKRQASSSSDLLSYDDKKAAPAPSDAPCWKHLKRNYVQCSEVSATIVKDYCSLPQTSRSFFANVSKSNLKRLTSDSERLLLDHCWENTVKCYLAFIGWWNRPLIVMDNIERLRRKIESNRKMLRHLNKKVEETLSALTSAHTLLCDFKMANLKVAASVGLESASKNVPQSNECGTQTHSLDLEVLTKVASGLDEMIAMATQRSDALEAMVVDSTDVEML